MIRRNPQEKKRLSYAKDRRNDYGENDKSSRKNIPRNKRYPHRANRHREQTVLTAATGRPDPELADRTEQRLLGVRGKSWRKCPDLPLGAHVEWTLRQRREKQEAANGGADGAPNVA